MSVVDERVARIRLDNQQFESAAKTSSGTLKRLKQSMDFSSESKKMDGFQNSLNRINFSGLNTAIELTKHKFSMLGTIGDQVTRTITNGLTNTVVGGLMKLGAQLRNGGMQRALNIEQAKFMFQGLGMDVKKSMESANEAVKGTAYGLDEAAKAASQFGASGMKAGSQMTSALRGIAGVAAMTGASYQDIADVFTTVSGNGRLMSEQLLQLSARGINAASTLGKYLHKSESQIRDMVSKGKIDFNTFAKAMDSAFGAHAKDANKTFTGSLSNMKAAINRIGADIATPYLTNARNIYNILTPIIDDVHKSLKPLLSAIETFMTNGANRMITFLNNLRTPLNNAAKYVGDFAGAFIKLGGETRGISIVKAFGQVLKSYLEPALKGITGMFTKISASDLANKMITTLEKISNGIKQFSLSAENGKKLTYIVHELAEAFSSLVKAISKVLGTLPNFGSILNKVLGVVLDVIIKIIDATKKVVSFIQPIFDKGSDRFSKFGDSVKSVGNNFNLLSSIANLLSKAISGLGNVIRSVIDQFTGLSSKSKDVLASFADMSGSFINDILQQIPKIASSLIKAVNSILKEIAHNLDWDAVFEIVRKGFSTYFFASFVHALTTVIKRITGDSGIFGTLFAPVRKAINNFGTLFGQVMDILRSKTRELDADAIMKIAAAVGTLAASFKVLSTISWEGLAKGLAGVAASLSLLIGALAIIVKFAKGIKTVASAFSEFKEKATGGKKTLAGIVESLFELKEIAKRTMAINAVADSLVKIAASVLILSISIERLSKIDIKDLAKGIVAMAAALGLLIGAFAAFEAIDKKLGSGSSLSQFVKSSSLIGYAASFYLLGKALENFNKIEWSSVGKGVVAASAAILSFIGLMTAMNSKIGNKGTIGKGSLKAISSFLVFSGSLYLLAKSMDQFQRISWDGVQKSFVAIATTMAVFDLTLKSLAKASKSLGKGSSYVKIGITIAILSSSLLAIAKSMTEIAKIEWSGIGKSLLSFASVMVTFTLVAKSMAKIKGMASVKNGIAVLELSTSLILIAKSLSTISKIPLSGIVQSITTIFAAFKIMAMGAREIKGADFKSVIAQAAAVAAIAVSLKVLSTIDIKGMLVALGGMSSAMLIIASMSKLMASKSSELSAMSRGLAKVSASMLLMDAVIAGMAATFKLLSTIPIKQALSAALSLTAVLAALYGAMKYIGTMQLDVRTVGKVALMALVIGGIGTVIAMLSASGADDALKASAGMSAVIVSVSVALKLLSNINVAGAAKAVGAIGVLVAGLGAIVAALGGIAQIPGVKWIMSEGKKFMQSIGEAFGALVGGFTGGAAATAMHLVSGSLPKFGSALSSFAENVRPFIELGNNSGMKKLPAMISSLTLAIVALSGASIANHFANLISFGNAIPKLGKSIEGMEPAMKSMNRIAGSIDVGKVKQLALIFKALGEFASAVPKNGGVFQGFTGTLDLSKFSKDIVELSSSMVKIGRSLSKAKFDPEPLDKLAKSALALAKVQRALVPLNGLQSKILGTRDLKAFSSSVEVLASSMSRVTKSLGSSPVNTKLFDSLAESAMGIAKVAKALPDSGGFKQKIFGAKDLSTLANGLEDLGKALSGISSKTKNIDFGKLKNFTSSLREFAKIINLIPDAGGMKQVVIGWKSYRTISTGLSGLGTALNDFYLSIWAEPDDAPDKIKKFAKAAKALGQLLPNIPDAHGAKQLFVGSKSWSTMSNGLADFGKAMAGFSKNISGVKINVKSVGNIVDASKKLVGLEKSLPTISRISMIFNKNESLADLASGMTALGQGMRAYGKAVAGVNVGAINKSVTGVKGLANVAKSLSSGSIFAAFTGKNNGLSNLAPQLSEFGKGMRAYGKAVAGVNTGAINKSVTGVKGLASVAKNLSASKLFSVFTGKNNGLDNLAPQLEGVGNAMKRYSKAIGNSKFNNIPKSVSAIKALGEVAKALSAGSFSKWAKGGNNGLDQLAAQLPGLGRALSSYASSVKIKSFGNVKSSASAITTLSNTLQKVSKGGNYNVDGFKDAVNKLRTVKVSGLGNGFKSATKTVNSSVSGLAKAMNSGAKTITSATNRLRKSVSLPGKFSSNIGPMLNRIANAIRQAAPPISSAFNTIVRTMNRFGTEATNAVNHAGSKLINSIGQISNRIGRLASTYRNAGRSLATSLRNGIESVNLGTKLVSQVRRAASSLSAQSGAFNSAGRNVGQGFVNGVNAMQAAAYAAGVNLGNKALAGAKSKKSLDIHSPSRAAYRLGAYTAQGLVNGIVDNYDHAKKAGSDLGTKVKDSLTSSVMEINDSLDGTLLSPEITPVINMSKVKKQAKQLGSILNGNKSLSVTGAELLHSSDISSSKIGDRVVNNNFNFTQNNHSPKALNAAEIYRNTKSQLAVLRNR